MYFWPTVILAAITAAIYLLMWRSWKRGKNAYPANDQLPSLQKLTGESVASFKKVMYVATNLSGEPLVRVQYPGLRYRGYANIDVLSDGVRVTVSGEESVEIAAAQIDDVANVQMRIGKVVEKDGLVVIGWHTAEENLESSFRFQESTDQNLFLQAVHEIISVSEATIFADTFEDTIEGFENE